MPAPITYHEIPLTSREREFVLDRRIAAGDHDPSDTVDLVIRGPFQVSAHEEADIKELRKHQDGRYGEIGSVDEKEVFKRVRERLLRRVRVEAMAEQVSRPVPVCWIQT